MTARAREALTDCEYALADFEAGANTVFQRSRWVAVMTLLRTVGYVLKKVDHPAATPETQQRIDDAWKALTDSKPDPPIFWRFINDERNDVVHLYEIRSSVNITVRPGGSTFAGTFFGGGGIGSTTMDFVMRTGAFAGRNPLDLCREAIEF